MTIPLTLLREPDFPAWLAAQSPAAARWIKAHGFAAEPHRTLGIPGADGELAAAIAGVGRLETLDDLSLWHVAGLSERLPVGRYALATPLGARAATQFLLGCLVGQYRFARLRSASSGREMATFDAPDAADVPYARAAAQALAEARDLINLPANALGPEELAAAARALAEEFGADCRIHVPDAGQGDASLPLLAAVGAGSPRGPRLIELRWGDAERPRVTLVGKGICFDSGGLDIKPAAGMLLMKKDMGGAACVLATARLLMALEAPIQLRVLIPAAENAVDGAAFRPGDVYRSRKGLSVEIGNTDAEGRLILADALALADEAPPELLIDFATLTGAARVALGPELPAAFANDPELLTDFARCAALAHDPVWPMPLWDGYDDELASKVADLNNVSSSGFAGAVIAALFLRRFVTATRAWIHLDLYAWNAKERPGRPVGAEAHCVRAVYAFIRRRFG